jgi:acyl carrier protein
MTDDQVRTVLAEVLAGIAPEADLDTVDEGENLRAALDLDSLDFLSLVEGMSDRTGADIPERDYGELVSIADWVRYVQAHAPAVGSASS